MKTNVKKEVEKIFTAPGAVAFNINAEQQLRRTVMACMLWENIAYEDGESVGARIASLIKKVDPETVANMAIEAREEMKLRHAPLLIVREMARLESHRHLVAATLERVIQRADELAEFVSIYWKDKKEPLSAQVKKGLAAAFTKFNAYQLAKYNRDGAIKLRDVLFLCHAKPGDKAQAKLWKKLVDGTLPIPDTWEVALSASNGEKKKAIWERLLKEDKIPAMAFIRNLRNFGEEKVSRSLVEAAFEKLKTERILPFRYITAAAHAPLYESQLEAAMLRSMDQISKLPGKTVLIIDVSGSMGCQLSGKSEVSRLDTAASLAILARGICEDVAVYATGGNDGSCIHKTALVPARTGMALRDVIKAQVSKLGGGGIFLKQCTDYVYEQEKTADRVIVITDEQDCDHTCKSPDKANTFGKANYLINISSEKNGVGYGKWTHIDGWSEHVIEYIAQAEKVKKPAAKRYNTENLHVRVPKQPSKATKSKKQGK